MLRKTISPAPPFDPELKRALDGVADMLPPMVTADTIASLRATGIATGSSDEVLAQSGRFDVQHFAVAEGSNVELLVCTPRTDRPLSGIVFWVHGGGMIYGDRRFGVAELLDSAGDLGFVIVSVEYRLAPEHPFPYAISDCYDGLTWTSDYATQIGLEDRPLIVAGVSGGGGLAASMVLLARDRSGPRIDGQMLLCPMLDDRNDTQSAYQMQGRAGVWDREENGVAWTAVLGDQRGQPSVSPYAAAARAADLSDLPPTYIDVGSSETFRDEDVAYASRIWASGGRAELHVWPGGFHGFDVLAPQARLSRLARAARHAWLENVFAQ